MASGHMALFNDLTMSRTSSSNSIASIKIESDDDDDGRKDFQMRQQDNAEHKEAIDLITQSNTPTGSYSNSRSSSVTLGQNQQQHQQQQHHRQQIMEQNLNNSAKNKKLFPQKLWDLINDERYSFCLRWSEDGQLVYLNRDEFEESYLKTSENQFHTQKAISFVRQMNMYGFRKVDDCYYENDNFKRDCEHLLKNMIRKHPNKNSTGISCGLDSQAHMDASLIDYRQHMRLPLGSERMNQAGLFRQASQQQVAESDCSNEDSFSSFGEPLCCSMPIDHQVVISKPSQQPSNNHHTNQTSDTDLAYDGRLLNPGAAKTSTSASAVYALLSSLNANLNQAGLLQPPQQQQQHHRLGATDQNIDLEHFINLQQLYQHILTSQANAGIPVSIAQQQQLQQQQQPPTTDSIQLIKSNNTNHKSSPNVNYDHQAINYSSGGNKSRDPSIKSSLLSLSSNDASRIIQNESTSRRESYPTRAFKRGANSILESRSPTKRNKNDFNGELNVDEIVTSSYARGLVTRIALSRDPTIDAGVIEEASRYTERFVETLFDTAQVMARNDIDEDRSVIKSSNLTSALRLLPSKLSKIIK